MSMPSSEPSSASTGAAPVAPPAPLMPQALAGARPATWLLMLALLVAVLALVMSALMWQKLDATQQELARRSQESQAKAVEARTLAAKSDALSQELQARLAVAEVKLSEVSLQRSQLEELMLTLSRSRDDTLVQDIESALRLAQQQAQLTGSTQPLVSALQAADQRIARAAQPRLNPVQRAIARDIDRIRSASVTDIPALVLRLDELARQVDEWPVLNEVGPRASRPPAAPAPRVATGPKAARSTPGASLSATVTATPTADMPTEGWTTGWRGLWSRVWSDVTRSGRELVRVSRIDRPEAVLLAPEQAFFLRENLKLKLLNARLGLLARQMGSAQSDIRAVEAALARYFDAAHPAVGHAMAALAKLREELVSVELPRPDESLAALTAAAGGR